MRTGRRTIYTDVDTITYDNVVSVLRKAMITHIANATDINFLINYEKGFQPLAREKSTRTDIDICCIDNVASEISTFKIGYHWGNPITLVQRGDNDKGSKNENKAIALLNECYSDIGIRKKTMELARTVEIAGIGYTYVDINTNWKDGDSYFTVDVLNPQMAFVVRSSRYPDKRVMLGVTYRKDDLGNKHFTCFSDNYRYEIENDVVLNGELVPESEQVWAHKQRSGEVNPLGMIPIIEWIRNYDGMGCFERCIEDMDVLNIMQSDFANDVEQNTNTIWHCNDVDFPRDEEGNIIHPKTNDWLQTWTSKDGKTPFVSPLAVEYNYPGMLSNIVQKRAWILQKCNVPQRNDNSGGSTGVAMSDATGWSNAEVEATMQQEIMEDCKMQEVRVVLAVIKVSKDVELDNPMLELKARDIKPNIKRQKTYEMSTKINTLCTALAHGLDLASMVKEINFFSDPQQVIEDSGPTVRMYQEHAFGNNENSGVPSTEKAPNADRIMQDMSDQVENSPVLDKSRA